MEDASEDHQTRAAVAAWLPFLGGDPVETILYRVIHTQPPRASTLVTVPPAVDAVFARALAKSPSERPSTATELAIALADALGYEAHTVTAAAPPPRRP